MPRTVVPAHLVAAGEVVALEYLRVEIDMGMTCSVAVIGPDARETRHGESLGAAVKTAVEASNPVPREDCYLAPYYKVPGDPLL